MGHTQERTRTFKINMLDLQNDRKKVLFMFLQQVHVFCQYLNLTALLIWEYMWIK